MHEIVSYFEFNIMYWYW